MKHYRFIVRDDQIVESKGEVKEIPTGFIPYDNNMLNEQVHYKTINGRIAEVIGESEQEENAREHVEEFISEYAATPPGAW